MEHNYMKELSSMVSVARNKTGKKAKDMAPLIGVSRGILSRIESGDFIPRIDIVPILAKFCCLDENLLSQAFLKAREQRDRERGLNKRKYNIAGKKVKNSVGTFSGEIEGPHMRHYLNVGLNVLEDNL